MKVFKFFLLSTILIFGVACNDDWLDLKPQGALDGSALTSPQGIEASLISAYSLLDGWNGIGGNFNAWAMDAGHWVWSNVASDDAHKGSEASDIADILQIEHYQWLPSNGLLEDLFASRYEGIARVNATANLNENSTEISADRKDQIRAECNFLRAHYHFDLYRAFKNVPYYRETDEDFRKTNDLDIMPEIIADMLTAVNVLPTTQSQVGRASGNAAKAYLGKFYLFDGQFSEAKTQFDAVVNSGSFALVDCYHDNFNAEEDNNSESIFAVQFSVNDGDPNGNNGNVGTRLGFPHSTSPFGCCGFNQPTQNLVNAFKTDASGLPITDNVDVTDADNVDPRLDWTVGRDDVPYFDYDNVHAASWIRDPSHGGPFSPKKTQFHEEHWDAYGSANVGAWGPQVSAINYNIIRYSDVLLMLAECEVELGNLDRARELVNMVRSRAGNCAQGPGNTGGPAMIAVPIDDPSITWANYKVGTYDASWTDATAAKNAVRLERRIELAMEGHRMYDLRRWGTLASTMNAYIEVEKTKRVHLSNALQVEDKHNLFPLPSVQIDLSEVGGVPALIQNPGF